MKYMEDPDNSAREVKKTRGGARPGAGRKKVYKSSYDFKRLKCKREIADLARTCITILDSQSEKELFAISAVNMDGTENECKGGGSKYWTDHDSFSTSWDIRLNGESNIRIFTLAYILTNPQFAKIDWFTPDGKVQLRWQRTEDIGRLMMNYGNLMARKNRLKASEQELLDKIPCSSPDILIYLKENLKIV